MAWSSIWQLYHSQPCYTWFEPIFTSLWSFFLCWQSLKKSYQQTCHNFCSKICLKFFLTIISFTAILHMVWAHFYTTLIILSLLAKFEEILQQTHHNFCSKIWLEVLLDNHIIHCHPTHGLSLFWHHYDPSILFEQF